MKLPSDHLIFSMPDHACNAHLHIIDPSFDNDGKALAQKGTVDEYKILAEMLHLPRAVFVQPKTFGTNQDCLLDAISRFGSNRAVGIAVVKNDVSDKELERLHEGGIRGLRFSLWNPKNAVVSFADCLPLSERVKDMGWNIQLHMGASQLLEHAEEIKKIKCRVVIDHMGRLDPQKGIEDPAFAFICHLIDEGRTWVKLSGPYLNTMTGEPWDDATATARAFASYAPERIVWGSDFPHVTEHGNVNEFTLVNMIPDWLPSEKLRNLALVKNPEILYGFKED